MLWQKLLNSQKLDCETCQSKDQFLTRFQKDANKVVFSSAFRCLLDKTQVDCLSTNSYIRTRLTHTLEVSVVARAIASAVQYYLTTAFPADNLSSIPDIVYAAALVHDIGNPPYGHMGEHIMAQWFSNHYKKINLPDEFINDYLHFDGNAQGFRVLVNLYGGLRLTCATLATFIKYPYFYQSKLKKNIGYFKKPLGVFNSEKERFSELMAKVGIKKVDNNPVVYVRHPLSFLLEAADDICYHIVDIEDAFRQKKISFSEAEGLLMLLVKDYKPKSLLQKDVSQFYLQYACYGDCGAYMGKLSHSKEFSLTLWEEMARIIYLRSQAIEVLIYAVVKEYVENIKDIISNKYLKSLCNSIPEGEILKKIKDFSDVKIYCKYTEDENYLNKKRILTTLMDLYWQALITPSSNPEVFMRIQHATNFPLKTDMSHIQALFDYIASMPEAFLEKEYLYFAYKK